MKRARYIDNSLQIRETFSFAEPREILKSINVYCGDYYGSSLWNLYGNKAEQLFRCWNTNVKLCWDLPRNTHTVFVYDFLSCNLQSIRTQCMSRYINFYKSVLNNPSREVQLMARLVRGNVSTNTGLNLINIRLETGLCLWLVTSREVKDVLTLNES